MAILLVITVLLPLVGSLALFLMPKLPVATARMVALVVTLSTLVLTAVLVLGFKVGVEG